MANYKEKEIERPFSIIILAIWFSIASLKVMHAMITYTIRSDFYIFQSVGVAPLFFVFGIPMFLLYVGTTYFLIRPHAYGYYLALSSIVMGSLENITAVAIAISNLEGARQAFAAGRALYGMSIRPEQLDRVFNPNNMYLGLTVALVIYMIMAFFILKNKTYFHAARPPKLAA